MMITKPGAVPIIAASAADAVYEFVAYTVTDPVEFEKKRDSAMRVLSAYPGFVSWSRLLDPEKPEQFADLVTWRSLTDAKAAAARAATDPGLKAMFGAIAKDLFMGHFVTRVD